jgi:ketosteroid isomerase-like protein
MRWFQVRAGVLLPLLLGAGCAWLGDERAIRARLGDLADTINARASEGLGSVTRAAEISAFFTDDVVVELGEGSTPIQGRETLIGMAMRLQPRLSEFTVAFADVTVRVAEDGQSADVSLTAEFIRKDPGHRQSMDAREFKLTMRRDDGEWKIARMTAVDTLK